MDQVTDQDICKHTDTCLQDYMLNKFKDVDTAKQTLVNTMIHSVGRDPRRATRRDWFFALAEILRGVLTERSIRTARTHSKKDVKRVYYLSMEYLIGRSLWKVLLDLGISDVVRRALDDFGFDLDEVDEYEFDAALGNGGLGRLAACFLDSLATHGYPGFGYGIRYEYGMFTQRIEKGQQVEYPENWLRYGNPWEVERPNVLYRVRFGGKIVCFKNSAGEQQCQWVDTDEVTAIAFDMPVSGYDSTTVGNLRLWSAKSSRDFNLGSFNEGNYVDAVKNKTASENLSKVLYPNDKTQRGQELRLKQEYFFVSASVQDIVARYLRHHDDDLEGLPDKVSLQLNDTHPALAVPELIRILVDEKSLTFENAFDIARRTFSYTNHTLLPEALETWPIDMLQGVLPRHLEIVYQINDAFLKMVRRTNPGDPAILKRVSLVDDDARAVRMAHLSIVASHRVNGVAALHTELLRTTLFSDFERIYPGKFVNQTNGITPRRWLRQANPGLAGLITEAIGPGWEKELEKLEDLVPLADDAAFREKFHAIKQENKHRLAELLKPGLRSEPDVETMFDAQVKRIHEYKRQLLNVLHIVSRYNLLRDGNGDDLVPRTAIFAGKAAPGYDMAKLIVRLINDVAEAINHDPKVDGKLKVVFVPDYRVTAAEVIIPGSDLSEQISTAGTEASGTGNMKLALNGALTIGTLDGANIEIKEEVGDDNIFIFGLTADGVHDLRRRGYDPWHHYNANEDLKRILDMIGEGFFSPDEPDRYKPIFDTLLRHGDHFLLLADYDAYVACQYEVDAVYVDPDEWVRRAVLNVARMGKFSSDRTIHGYAREIWGIRPLEV